MIIWHILFWNWKKTIKLQSLTFNGDIYVNDCALFTELKKVISQTLTFNVNMLLYRLCKCCFFCKARMWLSVGLHILTNIQCYHIRFSLTSWCCCLSVSRVVYERNSLKGAKYIFYRWSFWRSIDLTETLFKVVLNTITIFRSIDSIDN